MHTIASGRQRNEYWWLSMYDCMSNPNKKWLLTSCPRPMQIKWHNKNIYVITRYNSYFCLIAKSEIMTIGKETHCESVKEYIKLSSYWHAATRKNSLCCSSSESFYGYNVDRHRSLIPYELSASFFFFAGSSQVIAQYYQLIRLGFEVRPP